MYLIKNSKKLTSSEKIDIEFDRLLVLLEETNINKYLIYKWVRRYHLNS